MNYNKNSFLAGIAVGRQLKGWGASEAVGGDGLCILGDVSYSISHNYPQEFSDIAYPLYEGVNTETLRLVSTQVVVHGVVSFADVATALAEELNDEQHYVSNVSIQADE